MTLVYYGIEWLIGLSSGIAVGAGFVAFFTILGLIPRLLHLASITHKAKSFGICATMGAWVGTLLTFSQVTIHMPTFILIIWGSFHGIFVGMLAAALTEVLNVFPIISKRLHVQNHIKNFMMALVFGKIVGSLFQWIIFVKV